MSENFEESLHDIYRAAGLSERIMKLGQEAEAQCKSRFAEIDAIAEYNQMKVLNALRKHRIGEAHLSPSTGYGYNDLGRDALEAVYASVFGTEDALVRAQLVSGTHALTVALFGNLRPGDEIFSPGGKPYDTLDQVIGIRPQCGSLREYGVSYRQADLKEDGSFDFEAIRAGINEKTRLIEIQRSKGYSARKTLSVDEIAELIRFVKSVKPDVICMVDNCYGEFVERHEPSEYGADLMVGSLIKNPGGGLAPIGGYIAGKREYIENAAYRLTAPGLGKELGASLGVTRQFFQGLFLAPTVTASAEKGAIFAAQLYQNLGFAVKPRAEELRHDIIQSVDLQSPEALSAFCIGIQAASPVDSFVTPEAWDMPGYEEPVIMAAGTFVSGASIELSADGPMRPPYTAFFQGGLTYAHAKIGVLMSLQKLADAGLV